MWKKGKVQITTILVILYPLGSLPPDSNSRWFSCSNTCLEENQHGCHFLKSITFKTVDTFLIIFNYLTSVGSKGIGEEERVDE